ncbi:MAG: hemerythrin domain-containing protein [Pseudomonadota bacterium]|nr:hemerythrin domain-containing protein [Pseudomonadota bacterium]
MATRTQSTSSVKPRTRSSTANKPDNRPPSERSASKSSSESSFQWGSAGAIAGAALGGAIIAVAANLGRKAAVQGISAAAGNWADSLAAEHKAVLALFDKMLDTDDDQTKRRALLLLQLGHALDKHAYAEEHVVYTSLRENNDASTAELLEKEHGEVKTYLHRLGNMRKDSPEWLDVVSEFRANVAQHMAMEENEVFPQLRAQIDEAMDKRITKEVNKAGFMMA